MALDPRLLEILACPMDHGPLYFFAAEAFLYNPRLKKKYLVEDDVPRMMIADAVDVDEAEHQTLLAKAKAQNLSLPFPQRD
jgi:uncharacterized protein YbaR (Trm112 family)